MIERATKPFRTLAKRISGRLANKLILLFSIVIILTVGSLTMISFGMLQKESVRNIIDSTSNNLLLVNQNLEDYMAGIETLSLPQIHYDELAYAIVHESAEYASRMYLEQYLRNLFFSRSDLEAIVLFIEGTGGYYSVIREHYDVQVRTGESADVRSLSWYKEAMASPRNRSYQSLSASEAAAGYPVDTGDSFMAYHRVFRSIATREPQAVLSLYFNAGVKDELLQDVPFQEGQHLLFLSGGDLIPFHADDLDFYGRMVSSEAGGRLTGSPGGRFEWSDGNTRYLIVVDRGEREGWLLVKPIPYDQIDEAARQTRNFSLLIGGLFLAAAVILAGLLARATTRPLFHLTRQMNRFSQGDFQAKAAVAGTDEVAYLSRHFNQMVERTNEWINERYKLKLAEKHAVLKALESEINPHFLYNALQAISTKALRHDRTDIADMVDALAQTLRYCISGKETVLARDELQHIERYMSLQKARFGSRLAVEYEWEAEWMDLEIPKLSVQTLAENAIKHGLERVSRPVRIVIRASGAGDAVRITVADNGAGFAPDRIEHVRKSLESDWEARDESGGIGLVNLSARLKLLYGERAGLDIQSDGDWTRLTMTIPLGGAGHVQIADH